MTTVEIILDKDSYAVGDKVRGTFKLTHGGFLEKAEDVKIYLEVKGDETAEVVEKVLVDVIDPNSNRPVIDPSTGEPVKEVKYNTRSQTYNFLKKSLSSQVRSVGTPTSDGNTRIEVGTKQAQFQFELVGDGALFESFDGNSIKISYTVIGLVDKKSLLAIDARKELPLKVIRRPQIEGQGNKIRETSQNDLLTLKVEAEQDKFRRGDVISGKVTLNNPSGSFIERKQVFEALKSLWSMEYDLRLLESIKFKVWRVVGDSRTFEIKVPPNLTPSFRGINSEYRWELVARANSAGNLAEDLFVTHQVSIGQLPLPVNFVKGELETVLAD